MRVTQCVTQCVILQCAAATSTAATAAQASSATPSSAASTSIANAAPTCAAAAASIAAAAASSRPTTTPTAATAAAVELRRLPYTLVPKATADATALRAHALVHGITNGEPLFDPSAGSSAFAQRNDAYGPFSLWKDGYVVHALPGSAAAPSTEQRYDIAESHFKASIVVEHAGDYARADDIRAMPVTEVADRRAVKSSTRPEHFAFPEGELERFENGVDIAIMLSVNRHKFTAHPNLRNMLLATGQRRIVEASPWDANWGAGRDGKGLNKLGACLMALRAELREQPAHASA
jgi:ribA/ribD-fused uncharacterized protein